MSIDTWTKSRGANSTLIFSWIALEIKIKNNDVEPLTWYNYTNLMLIWLTPPSPEPLQSAYRRQPIQDVASALPKAGWDNLSCLLSGQQSREELCATVWKPARFVVMKLSQSYKQPRTMKLSFPQAILRETGKQSKRLTLRNFPTIAGSSCLLCQRF